MKTNELFPALVIFAAMVTGCSYAPIPNWLLVIIVLSGVAMIFIAAAYAAMSKDKDSK